MMTGKTSASTPPRRWPTALVATSATAIALIGLAAGCGNSANSYVKPPPPEVSVSAPVQRPVQSYIEYTGSTKAIARVDLRARVKGFLKEIHFKEGDDVKAGDLMFVIDEVPFKIQVDIAQAKLDESESSYKKAEQSKAREVAQAQIALDTSVLLLDQIEERRNRTLLNRNAGSREEVDKAEANTKKSAAQLESDKANAEQIKADFETNILAARASVESAKAELENAKINLGYCRVTAPIDGRISRKFVDLGNLVGDTDATVLATIVKSNPIYAYMSVSEGDLLRFRSMVKSGQRPDFRKELVPLDLGLVTEEGFPHKGRVEYVDPTVDPATGTIQARGIFENPDAIILPGLFCRIRVPFENMPNALLVPESALGTDQAGRFLLVVNPDNVVESRKIKLGSLEEDGLRVVEGDISPSDLVVVNGIQRSRPGQKVQPKKVEIGKTSRPEKTASAEKPKS